MPIFFRLDNIVSPSSTQIANPSCNVFLCLFACLLVCFLSARSRKTHEGQVVRAKDKQTPVVLYITGTGGDCYRA